MANLRKCKIQIVAQISVEQWESVQHGPGGRIKGSDPLIFLTSAAICLLVNPRIGGKLEEFEPREVRRILAGHYEMRYEIQESTIYVLRLWHARQIKGSDPLIVTP